jgi:hypothetical protein
MNIPTPRSGMSEDSLLQHLFRSPRAAGLGA